MPKTTHFGFQQVPFEQKAKKVAGVFQSVAGKYDLMNDLMSFGVHRLWKKFCISQSGVRPGQKVLDLAGGTGDLALKFNGIVQPGGSVVLADINGAMLKHGRERFWNKGITKGVEFAQVDAERLPFGDNQFDCITIAFGLRNVTDKEQALRSMYRVLKPGGRLLVLEFSKPVIRVLAKMYDVYSFNVIPRLGQWVAGDTGSYQYLVESIRMHPGQELLKEMMLGQGFDEAEYFNLTGGIVALHRGYKY